MQGAEEQRLRRIEQYAADDALMVDQGSRLLLADYPRLSVYDHNDVYCFGIASGLF
jgi:hypothetical protein